MQKIKISRIESKPTKKPGSILTAIYDEKDTRFSGFDTKLKDLQPGDTIQAEIEVDGKFNNIKSFTLIEKGTLQPAAPPTPGSNSASAPADTTKSEITGRARNTALMQAVKVAELNADPAVDSILNTAERFTRWLLHGEKGEALAVKERAEQAIKRIAK